MVDHSGGVAAPLPLPDADPLPLAVAAPLPLLEAGPFSLVPELPRKGDWGGGVSCRLSPSY